MTMRNRSFVRAPRKDRTWSPQAGANGTIVAATEAAKLVFSLDVAIRASMAADMVRWTASAIRLSIGFQFAAAGAVGDRAMLHYGVTWLDEALSVTAAPNLGSDDLEPWCAHGSVLLVRDVATVISMPRGGQV